VLSVFGNPIPGCDEGQRIFDRFDYQNGFGRAAGNNLGDVGGRKAVMSDLGRAFGFATSHSGGQSGDDMIGDQKPLNFVGTKSHNLADQASRVARGDGIVKMPFKEIGEGKGLNFSRKELKCYLKRGSEGSAKRVSTLTVTIEI
jgi:hypothetical protein